MTGRQWKLKKEWKRKRQGQVWVVEDQDGTRGYFKFATKEQWFFAGPMIANEYVAAALARKLGLPVAELEQASVIGPEGMPQRGIVSVAKRAREVVTWNEAPEAVRERPEAHVRQLDLLVASVVFDAWIANIDRATGKNLVLWRNDPAERYDWYLIDHGHCLHGSPRKWKRGAWNAPIWEQLWRYYNVPQGLLRLQSSPEALEPMIRQIERLSESDIDAALRSVPKGQLRERERHFIRRLLLHRQQRLRTIIERWLRHEGIKEYGQRTAKS